MNDIQKRAYNRIKNFVPESKKDEKRLVNAINLFNNAKSNDCGLDGKIAEMLGHDCESTITRVQKQGAVDLYIIIDGKRTKAEYKTNGGRIESLYRLKKPETTYIVYELNHTPADRVKKDGTVVKSKSRTLCKLLRVSDFLAVIEATKAVKVASHNNKNDAERAVQCSSKKLYEALKGFTDYDRNKTYLSKNL